VLRPRFRSTSSTSDAILLARAHRDRLARIVHQGINLAHGDNLLVPLDRGAWLETLRASRGSFALDVHDVTALAGRDQFVPPHRLMVPRRIGRGTARRSPAERSRPRAASWWSAAGRVAWSAPGVRTSSRKTAFDVDLSVSFDDLSEVGPILGTERWAGKRRRKRSTSPAASCVRSASSISPAHGVVLQGYELGELLMLARVDGRRLEVRAARGARVARRARTSRAASTSTRSALIGHALAYSRAKRLSVLLPGLGRLTGAASIEANVSGPWREPERDLRSRRTRPARARRAGDPAHRVRGRALARPG
jgi:hypothetical protein